VFFVHNNKKKDHDYLNNTTVIVVTLCSGKEKTIRTMNVEFVLVVLEFATQKKTKMTSATCCLSLTCCAIRKMMMISVTCHCGFKACETKKTPK
jgi:hypothetical protein